jgi:recombination protein RecT
MTDAIVKSEPIEPLAQYIRRDEVVEKFKLVLGDDRETKRFIQSVILLVETADPGEYSLKSCSPRSIVRCALKAATQRVTVNAEDRQAFMIPSKNKGVVEARFQLHYQEILNRAMRTNRYSVINVSPVFEGTEVFEDVYTGLHQIQMPSGLMGAPEQVSRLRRVSDRKGKRIGWLGYYRTTRGQEKTVYLTIEEIERRANFNKAHAYSFGWKDHRETMEMKTTLLALLRLADLTAEGMSGVKEALDGVYRAEQDEPENETVEESENIPDGEIKESISETAEEISAEELAYIAAGEIKTKKGSALKELSIDQLSYIIEKSQDAELVGYAQTRLDWINAHPQKTEADLLNDLGY